MEEVQRILCGGYDKYEEQRFEMYYYFYESINGLSKEGEDELWFYLYHEMGNVNKRLPKCVVDWTRFMFPPLLDEGERDRINRFRALLQVPIHRRSAPSGNERANNRSAEIWSRSAPSAPSASSASG